MFEDQNKNQTPPSGVEDIFAQTDAAPAAAGAGGAASLPGPPSALTQGKLQPAQAGGSPAGVPATQVSGKTVSLGLPVNKIITIAIVSVAVAGGIGIAFFWWRLRVRPTATPKTSLPIKQGEERALQQDGGVAAPPSAEQPNGNVLQQKFEEANQRVIDKALNPIPPSSGADSSTQPSGSQAGPSPESAIDTDQDGLNDTQELEQGTNPRLVDTDGDGLSDWEEVGIFGTNPLQADTDNDSYPDGEEVQNGYNPKGPGKLLDFDKAKGTDR